MIIVTMQEWLNLAIAGLKETVEISLMANSFEEEGFVLDIDELHYGSHLSFITPYETMTVSLESSKEGVENLSKMMMDIPLNQPAPAENDVVDCMGEVLNIFAGIIQKHLSDDMGTLQFGLPMFAAGHVRQIGFTGTTTQVVMIDDIPVKLTMSRKELKDDNDRDTT